MKLATFVLSILCAIGPAVASAQDTWPTQSVQLIVAYPAGGGIDAIARGLAQKLSVKWGKPVTVENRPGANTLIATDAVAHSRDGHTFLVTTDSTFTINPTLYAKLPYDLSRDFSPISMVASFSQMLIASPAFPANDLKTLISVAKEKPGVYSYASYGSGSQPHLAMEMLKSKAGIDIVHVPYRGVPLALNAVLANEVALTWSGLASAQPHLLAKTVKPIAYAGKTRNPLYPNVPTFVESGFPEVEANVWIGVFAPSSEKPTVVEKIDHDIKAILADPDFQKSQLALRGFEPETLGTDKFKEYILSEVKSRASMVKLSGAKVD